MDVRNTTTVIVGLVVAVTLVAGLMVPVITSLDNESGSDYTNTGDYYYKTAVDGESHTIEVTEDENYAYVSYDGENVVTKEKGTEGWSIPLMITHYSVDIGEMYNMYALTYYVEWVEPYLVVDFSSLNCDGSSGDGIPCTYNIEGTAFSRDGYTDRDSVLYHISTDGDRVLSTSPIVNTEQVIYGLQIFSTVDLDSDPMIDRNSAIIGMGTVEELGNGKTYPLPAHPENGIYMSSNISGWTNHDKTSGDRITAYSPETLIEWREGDIVVDTTNLSGDVVRLNGVDLKIVWENYQDSTDVVIEEVTFDTFIVPRTVEGAGSDGSSNSTILMTLISIIPLITVVGIVIGTVGFLRLKDQ